MDALRKFVSVRSSGSDDSLFMVSDKRTAALDQSLSELNLVSLLEGDRWVSLRIYSKLTVHSHTLRACVHASVCLRIHSKLTMHSHTQDQHRGGVEDHIRFPEGPLHNRAQHFQQDNRQDSLQVSSKPSKTLKKMISNFQPG